MKKERHSVKTVTLALAAALLASPLVSADDRFLEGFPDVPLLPGTKELVDERVVFDTPSGTVAQTTLEYGATLKTVLEAYAGALSVFGWNCDTPSTELTCNRESNRLVMRENEAGENKRELILRLEPTE